MLILILILIFIKLEEESLLLLMSSSAIENSMLNPLRAGAERKKEGTGVVFTECWLLALKTFVYVALFNLNHILEKMGKTKFREGGPYCKIT